MAPLPSVPQLSSCLPHLVGGGGSSNTGAIVGGVAGGIAVLLAILIIDLFYWRRSRRRDDFDGNFDSDRVVRHAGDADLAGGAEVTPYHYEPGVGGPMSGPSSPTYSADGSMRQYRESLAEMYSQELRPRRHRVLITRPPRTTVPLPILSRLVTGVAAPLAALVLLSRTVRCRLKSVRRCANEGMASALPPPLRRSRATSYSTRMAGVPEHVPPSQPQEIPPSYDSIPANNP